MPYPRLIRDHIPAIIAASGRQCLTTVLPAPAFRVALLAKLVEEAQEVQAATPEELLPELADVLEVVNALLSLHQFTLSQVQIVQEQRRRDRGSFESRLWLDWVG